MRKHVIMAIALICATTMATAQESRVYETRTVKSDILKADRSYSIYLPPGYEESDQSYPVLYLLHGSGDVHTGWVQFGQVQNIADKVIAEGKAGPMIIVMPDAGSVRRGYFNDIKGDFNYEDFFFKELIPHIEKTYRVRSERRYRAVSGLSMGGGGTLFYALHHPELFAAAAPLSAATGSWSVDDVKKQMGNQPGVTEEKMQQYYRRHSIEGMLSGASESELKQIKSIRWYISCGDEDFLSEGNSKMHVTFKKNEIPHEYRVKDGGHTWTYWRMELPIVLEFVAKSFMQH
ncbi:MAG: esterase family protein [Tannerellaceae bacterium]|nr:esterase family protein [Tannerellaceae bacterium]